MAARQTRQKIAAALALVPAILTVVSGCKTPSINLATSEAIKVDIAMRLDVYQHDAGGGAPKPVASPTPRPPMAAVREGRGRDSNPANAAERVKNRAADVQTFKNSRLVGEGHDGLLAILTELTSDYGDYVRATVAAENADRMTQMKALADKQKRALPEVQREQAALWENRSFKGEWIEVQKDGNWQWQQKQG
jgi:uncharacterized protein YdbL (DUF1318 family)